MVAHIDCEKRESFRGMLHREVVKFDKIEVGIYPGRVIRECGPIDSISERDRPSMDKLLP